MVSTLALIVAGTVPATAAAGGWQASRAFDLEWQSPSAPGAAKSYFLLRDAEGNPLGEVTEYPSTALLPTVEVPPMPGVYEIEAWLENAQGQRVLHETAPLYFDDVPPSAAEPEAPQRWLLASDSAVLRIGHPAPPFPLSGIRGYALAIDRGEVANPCANPTACTTAETDLNGGIGDDAASLGTLPEGLNYVRVATVSGAGVASPVATAIFKVDATLPRVSLDGVPGGWSATPVKLTAHAEDALSGMTAAGPAGPFTAIAVDGGAPVTAAGDTAESWVSGSGTHTVAFWARDAAGNAADGSAGAPAPQTARVRVDEAPPRVEFAAAQDPADPERIEAFVSDALSGPSSSRGSIGVRLAGTRARYEPLPTRVDGNRLIARWDSDSYPDGKYEFLASGYDAAGNAAAGSDRARGGRMVLVNPLKTQVSLTAKLSGLRLDGRLQRLAGGALAGQEVVVTESFASGAAPALRTSSVHSRSDGTFSLRLGRGPSRQVSVSFAGTRLLSRTTAPAARLAAKTRVRFAASATSAAIGGRPVIFKGKIATKGVAAGGAKGLPVELQFRYRGAPWSEFRTVETDSRGRFRYAYRFSDDDSRGVRFGFRAYVKGREGWPYEPSASQPVMVTGR
jgi:hypothetical protein